MWPESVKLPPHGNTMIGGLPGWLEQAILAIGLNLQTLVQAPREKEAELWLPLKSHPVQKGHCG
jgi:hypothetical protein